MRILLDINHPKDVNVFRNVIRRLEKNGHELKSIAGNKEYTLEELENYKAKISPNELHSFISFATLYTGEGATMAAEAAVLGVPSIYVSATSRGYLDELEERYGLAIYHFEQR